MSARPGPVTAAAILMGLISLASLPGPLLPGSGEVPAVVLCSGMVLAVLVSAAIVALVVQPGSRRAPTAP